MALHRSGRCSNPPSRRKGQSAPIVRANGGIRSMVLCDTRLAGDRLDLAILIGHSRSRVGTHVCLRRTKVHTAVSVHSASMLVALAMAQIFRRTTSSAAFLLFLLPSATSTRTPTSQRIFGGALPVHRTAQTHTQTLWCACAHGGTTARLQQRVCV
jgi:hypothetical protein